jgi:hypothetical protein
MGGLKCACGGEGKRLNAASTACSAEGTSSIPHSQNRTERSRFSAVGRACGLREEATSKTHEGSSQIFNLQATSTASSERCSQKESHCVRHPACHQSKYSKKRPRLSFEEMGFFDRPQGHGQTGSDTSNLLAERPAAPQSCAQIGPSVGVYSLFCLIFVGMGKAGIVDASQ